jgi:hypothetical protein
VKVVAQRYFVTWMRSSVDEYDHAVSDEFAHAGMRRGTGEYEALCGHTVDVSPMIVENGPRCQPCHVMERGNRSRAPRFEPAGERRRWLARILHRGLQR